MWCLGRQDKRVLREEKQLTVLSAPGVMNQAKYLNYVLCLVTQSCPTLCDPIDCSPPGFPVHGDSPGNNSGMGCHVLLQGIFPTQKSTQGLLHCRCILYQLSYQGNPSKMYLMVTTNPAGFQEYTYHMNRNNLFSDGFFFMTKLIISKFYLINFLKLVNLISFV